MASGLTKAEKKMIAETRDTVRDVKTVLVGIPGTEEKGLVGQVKDTCDRQEEQEANHNKLSRNFWILVGVLSGGGVLTGGVWGLLQI